MHSDCACPEQNALKQGLTESVLSGCTGTCGRCSSKVDQCKDSTKSLSGSGATAARTNLRIRTEKYMLTKLYNARPARLNRVHQALGSAVTYANGWTDYTVGMPDQEILRRLLSFNFE